MIEMLHALLFVYALAPLPTPTGTHPVGTTVVYLTDSSRHDVDLPTGRPITVQLWYPSARSSGPTAPYLYERTLGAELLKQGYYGLDSATLREWSSVKTHSRVDAPVATGRHPLVLLSVGQGVIRASYTSIAEELASHGEIVMLVESPLQGEMVLPSGREISDSAGRYGEPAGHLHAVNEWSRDISFSLDRLSASRTGAWSKVAAAVDWKRVGAIGHSTGGLVAVQTCELDARVRSCINMDGGVGGPKSEPMAAFVSKGITKRVLFLRSQPLYDDTTLARRGITRAEWERRGDGGRIAMDSLNARSKSQPTVAFVAGTGHFSFSDAPFVMPTAITRFGGRIIEPQRGFAVITSLIRAWFDQELDGRSGAFAKIANAFGEVSVRGDGSTSH